MGSPGSLLCIGHSHVVAVAAAARKGVVDLRTVNLVHFQQPFADAGGAWRVHESLAIEIGDGDEPVFSMVGGNAHTVLGLVRHPRPFDFVLPEEPGRPLDDEAELLPYDAVREVLERRTQIVFRQLEALAAHCRGRLAHLESPPPAKRGCVMERPVTFREALRTHGIASAGVRYRLWRLHSSVVRSYCERLGVPFVGAPAQSMSASGFLRRRLTANATHGNALYGRMVIEQMQAAA